MVVFVAVQICDKIDNGNNETLKSMPVITETRYKLLQEVKTYLCQISFILVEFFHVCKTMLFELFRDAVYSDMICRLHYKKNVNSLSALRLCLTLSGL